MVKKIIAWPFVWIFFYIGCIAGLPLNREFPGVGFFYEIYNWCMITSLEIQDWAGLEEPWSK